MTTEPKLFIQYIKQLTSIELVSEHKFHPTRKWRFDYANIEHKIALEVDGGVWSNGRHTRGSGYVKDLEKFNHAAMLGWRVLKVQPNELMTLETVKMVASCVEFKNK